MSLIFSISGARGIVGQSLTDKEVKNFTFAFLKFCESGVIVVGRDGRPSGKNISNLVCEVLSGAGCKVINLGIVPTPTAQLAVEHFKASGGISITASHNPEEWNGLKFLNSSGMFLNNLEYSELKNILEKLDSQNYKMSVENIFYDNSMIDLHINKTLSLSYIDKSKFRKKLKVVVDAVNASGSIIIPKILEVLNCEVVQFACNSSGIFPHTPEPIPNNLIGLADAVIKNNADLGIAVDPDADRLVLFTEEGKPFVEEYSLVAITDFILKKKSNNPQNIVTNLSTTRALNDIVKKYNATLFRTPVGEINVATKMKEVDAIIGGEGSGGIILSELHYGRDAIVGCALIIQYLHEFGGKASELRNSFPNYFILKDSFKVESLISDSIFQKVINKYGSIGKINLEDGFKIDFENSWFHLRKSNTEPIIRIITEAPTITEANNLLEEVKNVIK
ncbi:MAG: phosphoglucosamine mutase [Bacteroidetes bacterium]|nr:phosphoglucosamine mutase [Bacteroidota bacterium]